MRNRFVDLGLERLEARETPTSGLLDPTFGTGGLVLNPAGSGASTVAVEADGKLLVGGNLPAPQGGVGAAAVFRFNSDGSLDTTFGSHGEALLPASGTGASVDQVLPQPGGKVLVVDGNAHVYRLTASGHLDHGFGNGGSATLKFGTNQLLPQHVYSLANGELAVVGHVASPVVGPFQSNLFGVAHYRADGQPDTSYGHGGLVAVNNGFASLLAGVPLVLPDGKVVVEQTSAILPLATLPFRNPLTVSRYLPNGNLDPTFGQGGTITLGQGKGFEDSFGVGPILRQPDGKLILTDGGSGQFAAARLDGNGRLDTTFGQGGFASVQVAGTSWGGLVTAALQADGKLLLAGTDQTTTPGGVVSSTGFALVRLTASGRRDQSFGAAGVVVTAFPASAQFSLAGLALQADGNAVVAGTQTSPAALVLARYRSADHAFGTIPSHTSLALSPAPVGTPATLTATVTAAGATPTGTVTFLAGHTVLGSAALGPNGKATITTTALAAGSDHVTVLYSGDGHVRASSATGVVLISRASVSLTLSTSPSPVGSGQPVTLFANFATDSTLVPTGSVTFLDGNKVLGTAPVFHFVLLGAALPYGPPQADLSLAGLSPGEHTITARYSGDQNFAPRTVTLTFFVPVTDPVR